MNRWALSRSSRAVMYGAAWLLALVMLAVNTRVALGDRLIGVDFVPLRHAAEALLSWNSVYSDPTFVYPPSSAPVFLPLTIGTPSQAFSAWIVIGVLAQVIAAFGLMRAAGRPLRQAVVPLLVLTGGHLFTLVLSLGNLSVALVPFAVAIVAAFHRGRWTLGCALLAVSLLLKPLLLPLIIVPLAYRRYREFGTAMVPSMVVLAFAIAVVPGGLRVDRYVGYVLSGTNLRGKNAELNLSVAGWGESHGLSVTAVLVVRCLVLVLCAGAGLAAVRGGSRAGVMQLCVLACLAALLVGRLSENHFLLVAMAIVVARVVLEPSGRATALFAPGMMLLFLPPDLVPESIAGSADNNWFVLGELLLFVAAVADAVTDRVGYRTADLVIAQTPVPIAAG